jgi:hypothetical protein
MKALTLTAPWGTLVMLGAKRVETRRGLFKHRGLLWIHQSRVLDGVAWEDPIFRAVLDAAGLTREDQIPLGHILGSVQVVNGCHFTADEFPLCLPEPWRARVAPHEAAFGNYAPGRGGLLLDDPRPLTTPIGQRGMNGLWNWNPPAEALLQAGG